MTTSSRHSAKRSSEMESQNRFKIIYLACNWRREALASENLSLLGHAKMQYGPSIRRLKMRCHLMRRGKIAGIKQLPDLLDEEAIKIGRQMFEARKKQFDGFEVWDGARYSLASASKAATGSWLSNSTAMPLSKCRATRADVRPIVTSEPIGGAASTLSAAP
jgi:hypothetical protein